MSLSGEVNEQGQREWDLATDYADDRVATLQASALSGKWFAASFPDGQFVSPLDLGGTTDRAKQRDDDRPVVGRFVLGESVADQRRPCRRAEDRDVAMERRGRRRRFNRGFFGRHVQALAQNGSERGVRPDRTRRQVGAKGEPQPMVLECILSADANLEPGRVGNQSERDRERHHAARGGDAQPIAKHDLADERPALRPPCAEI